MARKREKQNEGVLLVLLHVRGEPRHCPGLATAAARWRPSGARVCVAETGKLQREGKRAVRSPGMTHGRPRLAGGGLRPSLGGGRRRSTPAAEEAERERGGRHRLDLFAISKKFRGPTVKQK